MITMQILSIYLDYIFNIVLDRSFKYIFIYLKKIQIENYQYKFHKALHLKACLRNKEPKAKKNL